MFLNRILPKFFIIGVQKAGTSSLASYLNQHPDFYSSFSKETDYFIKSKKIDVAEYSKNFKRVFWSGRNKTTFESSVGYFYFNDIPTKIFDYNPNSKFILLVRQPVERAISAWKMYFNFYKIEDNSKWNYLANVYKNYFNFLSTKSVEKINDFYKNKIHYDPFDYFREEIESFLISGMSYCEPGFIEKGLYYYQLKNYLQYFGLDQFIIVDAGELLLKPADVLNRITEFLGGRRVNWNLKNLQVRHKSEFEIFLPPEKIKKLNEFYAPYNDMFFELIKKEFQWN